MDIETLIERCKQFALVSCNRTEVSVMTCGEISPEQEAIITEMKARKPEVLAALHQSGLVRDVWWGANPNIEFRG